MKRWWFIGLILLASLVVLAGVVLSAARGALPFAIISWGALASLAMAWLIFRRGSADAVAAALAWSGAAPVLVQINGEVAASSVHRPVLPGADLATHWAMGCWPVNFAGLLALLCVFPGHVAHDPKRPLLRYGAPVGFAIGSALVIWGMWGVPEMNGYVADVPGAPPGVMLLPGFLLVVGSLAWALGALLARYRRGDDVLRRQLRWLMLAATAVLLLLAAGWVMQLMELPLTVSYFPFLLALLLLVPAAVAIAVIHEDFFDIDWLLSEALGWLTSALLTAALGVVLLASINVLLPGISGAARMVAVTAAALALVPLHRFIGPAVARLIDRETAAAISAVTAYVGGVHSGVRDPSELQFLLRRALGDPHLHVLLSAPDGNWSGVRGEPATSQADSPHFDLKRGSAIVARFELGVDTPRSRRRIALLAQHLALPLEMCRLHAIEKQAAAARRAQQERLSEASARERRALERDLHDGAQQRIISTGMLLRSLQRGAPPEVAAALDAAVQQLQETATELREIAHGIRPSRLDDGLLAALATLRQDAPVRVDVHASGLPALTEGHAMTAYFFVSEAVTNALKHAAPTFVTVEVAADAGRLILTVTNDGAGFAGSSRVPGLTDRLAPLGGRVTVTHPEGTTRVRGELPCAS